MQDKVFLLFQSIFYNNLVMETYNELLEEFDQRESSKELLVNYKFIKNEVSATYALKKQIFKNKIYELRNIRKNNYLLHRREIKDDLSYMNTFISSPLMEENSTVNSNHSQIQNSQHENNSQELIYAQMQNSSLKLQITNLKNEMASLKSETEEILNENAIFEREQATIEATGKQFQNYLSQIYSDITQCYHRCRETIQKNEQTLISLSEKRKQLKAQVYQLAKEYDKSKSSQISFLKAEKKHQIRSPMNANSKQRSYSKAVFEDILRAFYLILKLERDWIEQIPFSIEKQQKPLLSKAQTRLMNKMDIVEYYENRGVYLNDKLAEKISYFYWKLENSFDRIERANNQITESYQSLTNFDQSLNLTLKKAKQKTQRNTMISLQRQEINLNKMAQKLNNICKLIFQFNIKIHELLKKMMSFTRTFERIIKSASKNVRHHFQRKSFTDMNKIVLQSFELLLQRNPQDIMILWSKVINDSASGKQYADVIMKNDLLRVHATPEMYSSSLSELDNQENTYNLVFQYEDNLIKLLFDKLKKILTIIIRGIQQCTDGKEDNENIDQNTHWESEISYCVQSSDYFRRDNYKILEKLEKEKLKKRGLLLTIPFNPNTDNELESKMEITRMKQSPIYTTTSSARDIRSSFRKKYQQKYNELSFKREQTSLKNKNLRTLFENLSNMAATNVKFKIPQKTYQLGMTVRSLRCSKVGLMQ